MYAYIWEYTVGQGRVEEFVRMYGGSGDWVRLFRGAPGYVETRLLQDVEDPGRFVTIDVWESKEAFTLFYTTQKASWEALDRRGGELTDHEHFLGEIT